MRAAGTCHPAISKGWHRSSLASFLPFRTLSMSATADLERQLADALVRLEIEARRMRLQLIVMGALVVAGTLACLVRVALGIGPEAPCPVVTAWLAVAAISLAAMIGLVVSARRLGVVNKLSRELDDDLRRLRRRG